MDIFLNKDVSYDNNELVVILSLNYLQSDKHSFLYTSINQIAYVLTNRIVDCSGRDKNTLDRSLCKNIKDGLESLIQHEIIKVDKQDKNIYVIDTSKSDIKVDTKNNKYITLQLSEVHTIFSLKSTLKNILNLLSFYIYLVGTINNVSKEWHNSQDQIVKDYGGSKSSINSYFEQLEQLELIYVYRPNKRRIDGTYHKVNNSYGRYKDQDKVISASKAYIDTIECEDITSKIDRRSIKLRYNAFDRGSKKYKDNPELIKELYKECILYNKSLEFKPIEDKDNDFKPKEMLDLSVFEIDGVGKSLREVI